MFIHYSHIYFLKYISFYISFKKNFKAYVKCFCFEKFVQGRIKNYSPVIAILSRKISESLCTEINLWPPTYIFKDIKEEIWYINMIFLCWIYLLIFYTHKEMIGCWFTHSYIHKILVESNTYRYIYKMSVVSVTRMYMFFFVKFKSHPYTYL